jgi:phosphate transport system permease protein
MNRKVKEALFFSLFRGCALIVGLALAVLVGFIVFNGIGGISWSFLTGGPACREASCRRSSVRSC